jgi:hypothetical protein
MSNTVPVTDYTSFRQGDRVSINFGGVSSDFIVTSVEAGTYLKIKPAPWYARPIGLWYNYVIFPIRRLGWKMGVDL